MFASLTLAGGGSSSLFDDPRLLLDMPFCRAYRCDPSSVQRDEQGDGVSGSIQIQALPLRVLTFVRPGSTRGLGIVGSFGGSAQSTAAQAERLTHDLVVSLGGRNLASKKLCFSRRRFVPSRPGVYTHTSTIEGPLPTFRDARGDVYQVACLIETEAHDFATLYVSVWTER